MPAAAGQSQLPPNHSLGTCSGPAAPKHGAGDGQDARFESWSRSGRSGRGKAALPFPPGTGTESRGFPRLAATDFEKEMLIA